MKHKNNSIQKWLYQAAGKKKCNILFLLVIQIIFGIFGVGYALLMRKVIDFAVAGDKKGFTSTLMVMAGWVLFQIALRAVERFLEEYSRSGFENILKHRLFQTLLKKDYGSVTAIHSGEWMNRLTSDTVVVADGLSGILPGVAGMLVKMVGALLVILWMEPTFGYILIPGGFLLVFFSYAFRKVLKKMHKQVQETDGKLRVFLQENLGSLMIVRSFAREERTGDEAFQKMQQHQKERMRRNHFSNICNVGFGSVMNGARLVGIGYCGYGLLMGTMSYGTLMAVIQLMAQIQQPFANITGYLPKYYSMLASAERLREAEELAQEEDDKLFSLEEMQSLYQNGFQKFGLKNVDFTYQPPVVTEDGKAQMPVVLKNLNLEIQKGDYVAFMGASGCGKSTIMKLLLCLYAPDAGQRYFQSIENHDIQSDMQNKSGADAPLTSAYRRLFAYVPQGNHLMSGTIREIVAFADYEKMQQEEQVWQALRISCAEEFVRELPKGLDTVLGERGTGLSEGQMQRIAIARAIFSGNPILILDESTSALDENTEHKLLQNLKSMTDKTVLIVTHRPAVLAICNKQVDLSQEQ